MLYWQVVSVAATFAEVWEGVAGMVAEMDLLAGFAELAMCAPLPYVRPTMLPADASELKLTACRCDLGTRMLGHACTILKTYTGSCCRSLMHLSTGPLC
jgi:hypothetical protein